MYKHARVSARVYTQMYPSALARGIHLHINTRAISPSCLYDIYTRGRVVYRLYIPPGNLASLTQHERGPNLITEIFV